jgi:hypothetical protein
MFLRRSSSETAALHFGRKLALVLSLHAKIVATLGDFCQRTYHLACLFARLLCYDNSYIVQLCACCRALKPTENPAQSGTFFSGNRLSSGCHLAYLYCQW